MCPRHAKNSTITNKLISTAEESGPAIPDPFPLPSESPASGAPRFAAVLMHPSDSSQIITRALLPYQRAWIHDHSRFKIGLWARQTGKDFSAMAEAAKNLILTEFAFHENPAEIWRAIYPTISNSMQGGSKQLRILSVGNKFRPWPVPLRL